MQTERVERQVRLSADRAARLHQLAADHDVAEDDVIERALDLLFDREQSDVTVWSDASEASFGRVWDNDADAAYDDWRTLYGVPAG
jgi:predicted transcriptional regulator